LEITEAERPREQKKSFAEFPTSPFYFWKDQFFLPIKLGVQQQFLLGNKSNKNGVSVTANVGGGISLGY